MTHSRGGIHTNRTAIADLGHKDLHRRQAAEAQLLSLKDRAYAALLQTADHADPDVAKRAKDLIGKIRETVPGEKLERKAYDVVRTDDWTIAGRITPLWPGK